MIEILNVFPDNVVAVSASGEVTREDYEKVLMPAVDAAIARHDKVRIYYELGPGFARMAVGAMWDDFRLGVTRYLHWEGIAVVTDLDWIRHAADIFRFLVPGYVRSFQMAQSREARDWISGSLDTAGTRAR
ncbi:hypothetical protein D8I24_0405 (plasmid) [Cupriavidus necator H850]|uniref:STAS/SEC14 domain-containing protein n=1 Tax=Cupriavidus necator TaxID=106590 RepID=UPI00129DF5E6|nr:STAS/SEC14 domain-containing protein [Cupriavidus necator]KAI3610961.1 hypothetical protein D8I24_0405 [Cupriavidus necator H850]